MSFGPHMKSFRTESGLSQRQLGTKIGYSHVFLGRVESGKVPPSPALLERLADTFGVVHDDLFAAAGKVQPDIIELLTRRPKLIRLVRTVSKLRDRDVEVLIEELE